jgi:hypothetical protein
MPGFMATRRPGSRSLRHRSPPSLRLVRAAIVAHRHRLGATLPRRPFLLKAAPEFGELPPRHLSFVGAVASTSPLSFPSTGTRRGIVADGTAPSAGAGFDHFTRVPLVEPSYRRSSPSYSTPAASTSRGGFSVYPRQRGLVPRRPAPKLQSSTSCLPRAAWSVPRRSVAGSAAHSSRLSRTAGRARRALREGSDNTWPATTL